MTTTFKNLILLMCMLMGTLPMLAPEKPAPTTSPSIPAKDRKSTASKVPLTREEILALGKKNQEEAAKRIKPETAKTITVESNKLKKPQPKSAFGASIQPTVPLKGKPIDGTSHNTGTVPNIRFKNKIPRLQIYRAHRSKGPLAPRRHHSTDLDQDMPLSDHQQLDEFIEPYDYAAAQNQPDTSDSDSGDESETTILRNKHLKIDHEKRLRAINRHISHEELVGHYTEDELYSPLEGQQEPFQIPQATATPTLAMHRIPPLCYYNDSDTQYDDTSSDDSDAATPKLPIQRPLLKPSRTQYPMLTDQQESRAVCPQIDSEPAQPLQNLQRTNQLPPKKSRTSHTQNAVAINLSCQENPTNDNSILQVKQLASHVNIHQKKQNSTPLNIDANTLPQHKTPAKFPNAIALPACQENPINDDSVLQVKQLASQRTIQQRQNQTIMTPSQYWSSQKDNASAAQPNQVATSSYQQAHEELNIPKALQNQIVLQSPTTFEKNISEKNEQEQDNNNILLYGLAGLAGAKCHDYTKNWSHGSAKNNGHRQHNQTQANQWYQTLLITAGNSNKHEHYQPFNTAQQQTTLNNNLLKRLTESKKTSSAPLLLTPNNLTLTTVDSATKDSSNYQTFINMREKARSIQPSIFSLTPTPTQLSTTLLLATRYNSFPTTATTITKKYLITSSQQKITPLFRSLPKTGKAGILFGILGGTMGAYYYNKNNSDSHNADNTDIASDNNTSHDTPHDTELYIITSPIPDENESNQQEKVTAQSIVRTDHIYEKSDIQELLNLQPSPNDKPWFAISTQNSIIAGGVIGAACGFAAYYYHKKKKHLKNKTNNVASNATIPEQQLH